MSNYAPAIAARTADDRFPLVTVPAYVTHRADGDLDHKGMPYHAAWLTPEGQLVPTYLHHDVCNWLMSNGRGGGMTGYAAGMYEGWVRVVVPTVHAHDEFALELPPQGITHRQAAAAIRLAAMIGASHGYVETFEQYADCAYFDSTTETLASILARKVA